LRVYFAGPLFTPYERAFIDECAARLRADGLDVFVPHENVLAEADTAAATIFAKDLEGLRAADAVVAILDGPTVDELAAARQELDARGVEPEYLELLSADDLSPVQRVNGRTLLAVAARVGRARLIDNTLLGGT